MSDLFSQLNNAPANGKCKHLHRVSLAIEHDDLPAPGDRVSPEYFQAIALVNRVAYLADRLAADVGELAPAETEAALEQISRFASGEGV